MGQKYKNSEGSNAPKFRGLKYAYHKGPQHCRVMTFKSAEEAENMTGPEQAHAMN